MHAANLELCRELYELSRWNHKQWWKKGSDVNGGNYVSYYDGNLHTRKFAICPAYDLGYLLRKLPVVILDDQRLQIVPFEDGSWAMEYNNLDGSPCGIGAEAMTPEDVTCKVAIKLFKQGVLQKGQS